MTRAEWKAAWHGVRARGWSGVFVVILLAVALTANAVMFAFADSLVFRPNPFPGADRVFGIRGQVKAPEQLSLSNSPIILQAWATQADLVSAAGGYLQKTVFLTGGGSIEEVSTLDVTPGFFDVLGVAPRWGRGFAKGDERDPAAFAVIISEELARRRFGQPNRAPGQALEATVGKLAVVGVMDGRFAFPNTRYHIWRALDLLGPLTRNFGGVAPIVRVSSEVPLDRAATLIASRAGAVGVSAGLASYEARATPYFGSGPKERRTMVLALLGAAFCLLLAACANVASAELATAIRRARTYALQLALGASRWGLTRVAAIEGGMLVGTAFLLAAFLGMVLSEALTPVLPDSLRLYTKNPVDLDLRALAYMVVFAVVAWMVAALPPIVAAARSDVAALLKAADRSLVTSRGGALLRQTLTVGQIAIAVTLVIGGLLYADTYRNLLAVEKGFDSRDLYSMSWTMPADFPAVAFGERAVRELRQMPGVEAVTTFGPPPGLGDSPTQLTLEVQGRVVPESPVLIGRKWMDADYFSVVRLPLRQGRLPGRDEPATNVVVPELFAKRFFPEGNAVGATFRRSPREPWLTIIGVVGDFRTSRTRMPQPGDRELFHYQQSVPPRPAASAPVTSPRPVDTGGMTRVVSLTLRTDGRTNQAVLLGYARQIDPQLQVTIRSVDELYARQSEDTRLASRIVGGFSLLAFTVAMAGVYGVMVFLVAGRTREIGIRIALGADAATIGRLILSSSLRMVAFGGVLGAGLALLISRWIESQLFGVSAAHPATYAVTVLVAGLVSAAATWQPLRQAVKIDPAVTLRRE